MKILLSGSTVVLLMILSVFQIGVTSCKKDTTIIKTDTVLTADILTSHPWKYQEYRGVAGGIAFVYIRGGASNTYNYDNDNILFHTDGTGNLQDATGLDHPVTDWKFTNADHTQLTFNYYDLTIATSVTWDNIRYKNGALLYDEYYHNNYSNVEIHDQTIRIPK